MHKPLILGIVGATGVVGREIISQLERKKISVKELRLFASERSLGKTIPFKGDEITVEKANAHRFEGVDVLFFAAGSATTRQYLPAAKASKAFIIDSSSLLRQDPSVPLIIPEVNPEALGSAQVVASPNCSTTIMLTALYPLHKEAMIKRIVVSTYQAASGAGARGMADLIEGTKAHLGGYEYKPSIIPYPYAFNLFLHNSPHTEDLYSEEELKMLYETRKILNNSSIAVTATCVRVPTLRCHSEALNVEFHHFLSVEKAYELLSKAPNVTIIEDSKNSRFPMPIDAFGQEGVFCGRIRKDQSLKNTLELWVVGDQLLKGAAQNAVEICMLKMSSP